MIHRSRFLSLLLGVSLGVMPAALLAREEPSAVPYGENAAVGKTFEVNGIPLYYETYGQGEPLLIIHPNGASLGSMAPQISRFAKSYRVIAADSRGFGKSPIGEGKLTYEKMTADLEALMEHLQIKKVSIIGWSDGGIIGLMMAIRHPERVSKLAIMGANLDPAGANQWAIDWVGKTMKQVDAGLASHPDVDELKVAKQQLDLMLNQPNIPVADLSKITAAVLVMAGDRDIIRTEHTVKMFEALPKAQLCIFPGASHQISHEDPERFNRTVEEFLKKPFRMPDSKNDME